MSTAYLGLGSNIDARKNIASAIHSLQESFDKVIFSPAYKTPAHGFEGNDFINLVARVETEMCPLELKDFLSELENRHDRDRETPRFSDRTLDVDILLYDDLYLVSPVLEIPRAEILEVAYVLKPLADLAPKLVHPATGKTIGTHWDEFSQQGFVLELIEL